MCKKIIIITGHYGAGKTNFAINLALSLKKQGKQVTVADLDIVNPYFRTAEYKELIERHGIKLAVSAYAMGTLDVPAVNLDIKAALNQSDHLIIDVGGDPDGARVLGRFSDTIKECGYEMIYVINHYRHLTETPQQAVSLMKGIENATGLNCTSLFNNSHLGKETTEEIVTASKPFADEVAAVTGLPLTQLPVTVYVKPVWEI